MYISNVYNTWTLNAQTFSLIKCIDLSILSTLYITHTQPLPILSWHRFFKVQPLWSWFQTQGCTYLYNWDLCPSCCPGSTSTRCPSSVSRLLPWLILNKVSFYRWLMTIRWNAPLIWFIKAVETKHFFAVTLNWKPNLVFILLLYMRKSRPDESQSLEMSARFHSNLAAF